MDNNDVLFKEVRNAMTRGTCEVDETRENAWVAVYDNIQYDICMHYEPRVKPVKAVNEKSNIFTKAKNAVLDFVAPMRNFDTWVEVKKQNLNTGKQEAIAKYTGAQKRILMNSCAYSGLDL